MLKALAAVAALTIVAPATAAEPGEGTEKPKKERLVCKRTAETATRTRSSRTCRTASEWRALTAKKDRDNETAENERLLRSLAETPTMTATDGPR